MIHPYDTLRELQAAAVHRLNGTMEAAAARRWITKHLRDQGLDPVIDDFTFRTPGSLSVITMCFNAWLTLALGWFAATVNPWVGLASLALINLFDFVLAPRIARSPETAGTNILVGVNRPWSDIVARPRPLLIVTAHYDTARAEPRWLRRLLADQDNFYSLAAIGFGGLLVFWISLAGLSLWPGAEETSLSLFDFWQAFGRWAMAVLCLPIALAVSLWSSRRLFDDGLVNPGANDNGSGVAVALHAVPALRQMLTSIDCDAALVFPDAEEVGLRGTRDFVMRHARVLDPARTTIVNLDGVGRGDTLVSVKGQGLFRQRRPSPTLLAHWDVATRGLVKSQVGTWMTFFTGGTDQDAWLSRGFSRTLSISHGTVVPRRLRAMVYRVFGIVADPVDVDWTHLHSPEDSLDAISPAALQETTAALLAFARAWIGDHPS